MAEDRKDAPDLTGLVENAFLMGMGVMGMTRDKVGEFTDDLIERGKMTQAEAKKVTQRMTEAGEDRQTAVRVTVAEDVREAIAGAGLATSAQVAELRADLAEIKALLQSITPPPTFE